MLTALLFSLGACAIAIVSVLYARSAVTVAARSAPNALTRGFEDLGDRVRAAETNLEGVTSKLTSWRVEIENVLDAVEGTLDQVEKKRRSAAAAVARADRANGEPGQGEVPLTDAQLFAMTEGNHR